MKAMILAAGFGKRLQPHTLHTPKPAITLFDKPLLHWTIEQLTRLGIWEMSFNAHHLPTGIRRALETVGKNGFQWHLNIEEGEILGTAGGLKALEPHLTGSGTFLMVNGDILFDFDLGAAIDFHLARKSLATMILWRGPGHEQYPQIGVDEGGALVSFRGERFGNRAPVRGGSFTGIHIFEEEIFDYIPSGRPFEINDEVYPRLLRERAPVHGFVVDGYWNDIGTLDRLHEFHRQVLRAELHPRKLGYWDSLDESFGWLLGSGSEQSGGVSLTRPCYLSPRSATGEGLVLGEYAVVNGGVLVDDGAQIADSVLLPGARIAKGEQVTGQVLSKRGL